MNNHYTSPKFGGNKKQGAALQIARYLSKFLKATVVLLFCVFSANAQYSTVTVSGFNEDVIAEGTGAVSAIGSTTNNVSGDNKVLMANGFKPSYCTGSYTQYLPVSPTLASPVLATPGLNFTLAGNAVNNALRLAATNAAGTLTFATPVKASNVYILGTSGSGASNISVVVNFTDLSTQAAVALTIGDWYQATPASFNAVVQQVGRVTRDAASCPENNAGSPFGPNLYQLTVPISGANFGKLISSITITGLNTLAAGPIASVMAVSVQAPCATPSAQLTIPTFTGSAISTIGGSFTAAAGSPSGYLIVRYPTGATPVNPNDGTTYTTGQTIGTGVVVQASAATTFTASGLTGSTTYDFYAYAYNTGATCGGPVYLTSGAFYGTQATAACGSPSIGTLASGTLTIKVGSSGFDATTIAGALSNMLTNGISTPVVIELQSNYVNELTTNSLVISTNSCFSAIKNVIIRPAIGANGLTLSSSVAGPTIDFDGASYVTIDGTPGGTSGSPAMAVTPTGSNNVTNLNIKNTSTTGVAVRYKNDASNNTLKYVDLQGANSAAPLVSTTTAVLADRGIVFIGTTTGLTGSDNIIIDHCNIHPTLAGATMTMGIYSYSTQASAPVPTFNDLGQITNNNIYDIYGGTSLGSTGVGLAGGTDSWTISNNNFFQTGARTPALTASIVNRAIFVTPTNPGTGQGNNFTVSGNFIGGSTINCGGAALASNTTGSFNNQLTAIEISVAGGTASNVKTNTITNINISQIVSTGDIFRAIAVTNNGNVNVGGANPSDGNIVGSSAATGAIILASTGAAPSHCILVSGGSTSATSILVKNNKIGGIRTTGTGNSLSGIFCNSTATITIDNNLVGSRTIPLSFEASGATTTAQFVNGIRIPSGSCTANITNNVICNLNNNSTSTTSITGTSNSTSPQTGGIIITGSVTATQFIQSISGNIIRNLSNAAPTPSNLVNAALVGIGTNATTNSSAMTISNNIIDSLVSTCTSTTAAVLFEGIAYVGLTANTNVISNNQIHSFDYTGAVNPSASFRGIECNTGAASVSNNMIRLGIKADGTDYTTPNVIYGILQSAANQNFYHNSVYIGGSNVTTGANLTYAFNRFNASASDIRNNIFVNARSNSTSTGKHYTFYLGAAATGLTLNNNDYYAPGTGGVMGFNGTSDVTSYSNGWISGDANSFNLDPKFLNPTGKATIKTGVTAAQVVNLHINTLGGATPAESTGAVIASVTQDIDGDIRSGSTPDIGADEGSFTALPTCAAPTTPSSYPTLAAASSSVINGTISPVSADGYLVVRYLNGATPTSPVNGTVYTVGASIGAGVIVSVGASTSFSATGLLGATAYDFYTYSYNAICIGTTPNYQSSALIATNIPTLSCAGATGVIDIGTGSVSGYTTINGAITGLNLAVNGIGAGGLILELLQSYGTTTESVSLTNYPCLGPLRPLTIRPASGVSTPVIITSASTTATLEINGANYITIDGRAGGTGTPHQLIVENTSTTAAAAGNAILIRNDASNNFVKYTDIRSANANLPVNTASTTVGSIPGAIAIGTSAGGNGNDNNTLSNNKIHSLTSGGNLGAAIYAGNSTTAGALGNNDNTTIDNNSIYDFFLAASTNAGINISLGNNTTTITNNSIYQTGTRTYTTALITTRAMWITPSTGAIASASGNTISNNYIGGTAPSCGGTAMTMNGTVTWLFNGMDVSVGTGTVSNIQNNTITNINMTSGNTGSTAFVGINIANGNLNIGTVTGNLIGSTTVNGAITFTTSANTGGLIGIRLGSGSTVSISNNIVSGIDLLGSTTAFCPVFNGINVAGGTTVGITSNTIGSGTLANSINASTASISGSAQSIRGIIVNGGTPTTTITGNLIANMNTNIVATGTQGNSMVGIAVTVGSSTISNNIIRNFTTSTQTSSTAGSSAIIGISNTSGTAPQVISGNTIHTLKLTGASLSVGVLAYGIYYAGPSSGTANIIEKNNIHSISVSAQNPSAGITGIEAGSIATATYKNNMIRLGYDETGASITAPCLIRGFAKLTSQPTNIWNNSIFVGGSNVGTTATSTYAFIKTATGTDDIRNNIFVNNRSNATTGGKHYQISLNALTTLTLDYNSFFGTGTGSVFAFNGTSDVGAYAPSWVTGDLNSKTGDPLFLNATGSAALGNLHIDPSAPTPAEGNGVLIASVTDDFDGQTRASFTPNDIGADAGDFTPLVPCVGNPPASTAALSNPAAICGSGTRTIFLSGFTTLPGYTYQWQESATGTLGSFVDVTTGTGATTVSYTTATLTSSMYYQCVVTCNAGPSTPSSSVQVIVNPIPSLTVSPLTGTNVCSGSNVDLSASGASTYAWTCATNVAGYPNVSLFSTPNNLATVTSRPTSTLASSTTTPPATVATPTWTYTVTGTSAAGCASTPVNIVLNVITTATVPLQLTYTSSPSSICAPGTPITFNLNNPGVIGAGNWTYNWYNQAGTTLLQSTTNTLATDAYTTPAPVSNGNYIYTVKVSNSLCPSSYAIASPTAFVGYTSLNVVTNANCGDNGIINVYPEGQDNLSTWYSNDFNTGLNGPAFDALYGNAVISSGRCNITTQTNSQNGTLLVRNPGAINSNNLTVDFKLSTAPRGYGFSILGADGLAWSYAPDVWQGQLTPLTGGFQAEGGSGTGFKLAFDATANGAGNTPGAYLMYNCTTPDQGPTSSGVLAFKQGSFWQGLVDAPVSIIISEDGYVSVTLNNQLIFDHVALPAAYLTANKSNWLHAFTARTGGSNELHAIDDLNIRYNTTEYSITSTTGLNGTWQTTNKFSRLAAGSYPVWVRNPSNPSCFANTGTAVVGTSPSPSSAITVAAPGFGTTICAGSSTDLTTDVAIPGAVFLWETASSVGGPYTAASGINNLETYSTGSLLTNAYYRCTFTCPSSSPITSTPVLVVVNSGSISSTNSQQMVNCLGDAANLTAVPGPNTTCVWYADATGGSPLGSGNSFSPTPTVLPTTYYVEPVTTLFTNTFDNGGQKVIANTFGTATTGTSIATRFTTTASVRIDIIQVNPGAAGTLTVQLQNAGSAGVLQTFNQVITAGQVGSFINVPVNFAITGSGNYQLTTSGVACSYYSSYSGTYSAPYMTMGGGALAIVGGSTSPTGSNSTAMYGTSFNWTISTSCSSGFGSRIPVVVNSNPAFLVSVTPASTPALCAGSIQALTASSPNSYSSYTWSPVTNLFSDALATIPLTLTDNQATVYFKSNSVVNTTYTVSTAGGGCNNTATGTVGTILAPVVSATATPNLVVTGGNSQLNAGIIASNVNNYVFAASSGIFTPISGGTATSITTTGDEEISTAFNIGFNFGFGGANYSTAQVSSNGTLLFGGGKSNSLTNNLATSTATQRPGVAPLWDDLQCSSGVKYLLSGTPGTQVLTVEWLNMEWNWQSSSTVISFQVKLYEGSNAIEFQYRDDGAAVNAGGASIGIMGTSSTDFISLQNTSASPTTSTSNSENTLATKPANGQIYSFTPPNLTAGYTFDWSANGTFLSATNISNPTAVNMTSGQNYSVTVTSPSGCPTTQSVAVNVLTDPPLCPATVTVNNASCITTTSISWSQVTQYVDGYNIYVATDFPMVNYIVYQSVGINVLSIDLPILDPNTTYYYQIAPFNAIGENTACTVGQFVSGPSQSVSPAAAIAAPPTPAVSYNLGAEGVTPPILPCGITIENADQAGNSSWYTSSIAPHSGSNHMRIDKNSDNITALDDYFFTVPINVTAGKVYRITWWDRASSASFTEKYEVRIATLPDASTMSGSTPDNFTTNSTSYAQRQGTDYLAPTGGPATIYYGFRATSLPAQGSLYIDDVQVREIPVPQINPVYCTTLPSMYDQIFVTPISGATNYRFKIVGTGAQSGYNFEHYRNNGNPDYRLKWAPGVIYGYTYNVQVASYVAGVWSPYGPPCPVSLGAFPAIKLRNNPATVAGPCDYVISDLNDRILTDSLSGANDYMYKIVEDVPGGAYDYDFTWQRYSGNLDFRLVWAYQSSPLIDRVRFGYKYDVQTRALVGKTGAAYGNRPGEWGPYGTTCKLDLSATSPSTSLTNCNITLATLNDQIFTTPVTGATNYEYEFTAPGYTAVVYRGNGNNDFRMIWIPTSPAVPGGPRYATTYSVRVKAYLGGVWLNYGAPCTVTTPAAPTTTISTVGFCGSTLSPGQFSSTLNVTAVPGASSYSYRITNVGGVAYSKVFYNFNSNTTFSLSRTLACCGQQNLLPNATYTIEVAYFAGVWSAYGPACTFTTGATVPRYSPFASEGVEATDGALNLSVYPNPATLNEQYALELQGITAANEKVQVAIYNMIGDRVYRADVITKEQATLTIKPELQLAAGVYMAEAQLNGNVYRVKFVVK